MAVKTAKIKGMANIKSSSIKKRSMPNRTEDAGYLKMFVLSKEKEMLSKALNTLTEKRNTIIERLTAIKNEIEEKLKEIAENDISEKDSETNEGKKKKEFKKMKMNY
ncbi:MAG TPA: hypothetical protein DD381_06850 [Lentisphaeria bacterium]|nr:MAG: hypothetical protein A2X47_05345 [Lentisphaerae bacterium GWF2_38_69]HBM16041.1 hypothetical protein [Lentisphaeria bacterium]